MNKQSQQGSAHVVIVTVLTLALITALGWIFYQNFIYKEPVVKETDLVVVDKNKEDANSEQKAEKENNILTYINLDEWNVRIPVSQSAAEFSVSQNDDAYYIVSSSKLNSGCQDKKYAHSIGTISRYIADEKVVSLWGEKSAREMYESSENAVIIGKYLYHFAVPQGSCLDPTTKTGKAAADTMNSETKRFVVLFKKLETSN